MVDLRHPSIPMPISTQHLGIQESLWKTGSARETVVWRKPGVRETRPQRHNFMTRGLLHLWEAGPDI
jgi:hypothetical protein